MRERTERDHEVEDFRCLLAVMSAEMAVIRARRNLTRKYRSDQPRAPAGQTDGGQWVSDGSGGGAGSIDRPPRGQGRWASLGSENDAGSTITERTATEDGGQVLSIRIRAGRGKWDEQHTVITPEGESRIFENSGATQTIRDRQSGEVLSRSTFTASGVEPEATVQPAFLPVLAPALPAVVTTTIEAAALLFTVLSARKDGFGTVLGMTAQRYDFESDPDQKFPVVWVGRIDQAALNAACPRNAEVQAVTDAAYARLKALNPLLTGPQFGTLLHVDVGGIFKAQNDPNMIVELSLDGRGKEIRYGAKGSVRLDLFERTPVKTVCVYDYKTGNADLSASRALMLAKRAKIYYPEANGIIIVQVKPK